ncbi:hypothetical protein M3181_04635 [Mesobacillus maritimus]|uniref:hypothetical protein n=1 Tax=Mesobacillus maritimus TaxID=1643336 RepID=UPI00203E31BA|nr:hypothetical protein [Mesobacillus maritimus]MCM3668290.1 hypothetical protein [Mesobacillus maritimus]
MRNFAHIGYPFRLLSVILHFLFNRLMVLFKIVGFRGLIYLGTMVGLYYFYHKKSLDILLPIIIGIFISDLIKTLYNNLLVIREDKLKTSHSMTYLKDMYHGNYEKELNLNGNKIEFLYDCCVNNKDYKIVVKDQPKKMFVLTPLIKSWYSDLMQAHKGSYIKNFETIRLDDYSLQANTLTLTTSRSNFYNHLLTNRAIDYEFQRNISIRKVFEFGPLLKPLNTSKLSNHIGINGIVLLSDGYTLIPRRGGKATYSKNKMTASIAAPLTSTSSMAEDHGTNEITYQGLLKEVKNLLKTRLYIEVEELNDTDVEVNFLGFGREVYEGGKPQFYFMIKLKTISSKDYLQLLDKNKKRIKTNRSIDKDSDIYVCNLRSLSLKKNYSGTIECLNYYTKKVKFSSTEMSFLANYWHLEQAGYLELFNINNAIYERKNHVPSDESWGQLKDSV